MFADGQDLPYDEATLTRTMVSTPDITMTPIEHTWSATLGKNDAGSVIVHSYASWDTPKIHRITRFLHRPFGTPATVRS